ncbi:hypothetical protein [Deinococcus hopiensis]|uniref:Uncharacterized protein n=1 Tax=Deinococcus hopiensis KR-140 TaxID=695939 RepID=A0A1W1UQA2_9DEIO|nr:hypothetical protein [Deinococcus hopiensis]SMB82981.1 hypothetical protein SAMN00790413_04216 [Deinococcus hopiensis KR-140]
MKKLLILGALLTSTAGANSLSANLPAGAVATLETQGFGTTATRVLNVLEDTLDALPAPLNKLTNTAQNLLPYLNGSLFNEATLGLFTVGSGKGPYALDYLVVMRVDSGINEDFQDLASIPEPTARVGRYGFARDGGDFVGQTGDLVYISGDKNLLMNYLGKLSGKAGPRLGESAAYSAPAQQAGKAELSAYLNFSAGAKLIRQTLAQEIGLPRLFSPIVDAVDTLGQWRGGLSSTEAGFQASSVLAVNPAGKDAALRALLTHTRPEFEITRVLPADATSVSVNACDSGTGAYLGRWLTRIDLIDPTGFLSDTQLASELEAQSRYLGDECAQITVADALPGGQARTGVLAGLSSIVTFQNVTDEEAARAHAERLTQSVNAALRSSFTELHALTSQMGEKKEDAALAPLLALLDPKQLDDVSLHTAFKDGYLITAFSQAALDKALNAEETLADNEEFTGSNLTSGNAAFSWSPAPSEEFTGEGLLEKLQGQLRGNPAETVLEDPEMQEMAAPVLDAFASVLNRYGGASSTTTVTGTSRVTQGQLNFDWE